MCLWLSSLVLCCETATKPLLSKTLATFYAVSKSFCTPITITITVIINIIIIIEFRIKKSQSLQIAKISFSKNRPSARLNSPQTLQSVIHTAGFQLQNKRYFFRVFHSSEGKRKADVERETCAVWEGVTCEQQTNLRSSLLSLRKIASANPSGKTIPWRKTFCFDDGQSDQRRERSDDRKCVCC